MLPLLEFCLVWASQVRGVSVTTALCVTALLCTENTVPSFGSYSPFFHEFPELFGEGCDMYFLLRADHFTVSYSCIFTGHTSVFLTILPEGSDLQVYQ